jgi:hypothetical protein
MQQGLGRYAADVEAGTAERAAAVDASGFQAELAQPDRRIVPAGPATDYDRIELICHDCVPECR